MKKVLIFIMLLICSCIGNATENKQLILVAHIGSHKYIVTDTLIGSDIIYTERALMTYVLNKIPKKFYDISEEYVIGNAYSEGIGITNYRIYLLYYNP